MLMVHLGSCLSASHADQHGRRRQKREASLASDWCTYSICRTKMTHDHQIGTPSTSALALTFIVQERIASSMAAHRHAAVFAERQQQRLIARIFLTSKHSRTRTRTQTALSSSTKRGGEVKPISRFIAKSMTGQDGRAQAVYQQDKTPVPIVGMVQE